MKNNRRRSFNEGLLFLGIFTGIYTSAFTQEMSLDEVLKRVSQDNREIRVQEMEMRVQDFEVDKSMKEFLPTVELQTDKEFIEDDRNNTNDWTSDSGVVDRLSVDLPIFTGFENTNNYRKSKVQRELASEDDKLIKYNAEERGISLYFEVLNKRRQAEISESVIENLSKEMERLKGLFENGQMIPKSELLKVEADIKSEEARKSRREKELRSAEEALYLLMGVSLDSDIVFTEYVVSENMLMEYDLEKDLSRALSSGSKAQKEKLLLEDADLDLKLARVPLYPQINGNYTYRFQKDDDEYSDYQVSLIASWEIFSWGSTIDDIRQKDIQKSQAELNYERRMDEIALEIRDKYREMMALYDDVKAQEARLNILRENLEIDNLRYNNNLVSSLDYLISVNDLSETATTFYALERDLLLRQREYENLLK